MSLVIRPATLQDAAVICRLNLETLGYDYPLDRTQQRLEAILRQPENRLWIAELEGRAVGYVHGANYDCAYTESLKNILALAVDRAAQRQGVGRALVAAVEAWARACGCAGVRLVSGMDRQGAHLFYEACGYRMRKAQKNFIRVFGEPGWCE